MLGSQNQSGQPAAAGARKRFRTISGLVLMVLGVAVMAYGTHYVAMNGTCSSTGYASFGPVPTCRGNEFLYITSTFFLGPAVILIGWVRAGVSGVLWPVFCIGMAVSLITIRQEAIVSAGGKSFAVVAGEFFVVLALVSVVVTVRKRLRPKAAQAGTAGSGTALAGSAGLAAPAGLAGTTGGLGTGTTASPSWAHQTGPSEAYQSGLPGTEMAAGPGPDPLDTIAKLARLRDSGAITDEEYERQKTKLLSQM